MKKTFYVVVGVVVAALWATPASAQTAAGPVVNLGYGGLVTGTASVHKTGGVVGAEAGARVWRNLDVFLEGGAFSDVVPQRQIDAAAPLTTFLQETQGQTATATVKMPAAYFSLGGRWVFEDVVLGGWARPYVQFGFGGVRVKRQPTFTLAGADVTGALDQYGVRLGADLTATDHTGLVTGGAGVLIPYRMLYVDVGYRLTSIRTSDAIGINRFNIGVGARF